MNIISRLLRTGYSKAEMQWITSDAHYSPDLGKLEEYEYQLLFCPDRTQTDLDEHHFIEDGSRKTPAAYTRDVFKYHRRRSDGCLIPLKSERPTVDDLTRSIHDTPALPVKGEIHAIRPWQFKDLDFQRRNGVYFTRRRVQLIVPFREVISLPEVKPKLGSCGIPQDIPFALQGKKGLLSPQQVVLIRAWMYVGNPEYWDPIVDAGYAFETVARYNGRQPWKKEYYSYNKYEHNKFEDR